MLIDSHCHLDFPDFDGQIEALLTRMKEARVSHALCVAVDLENAPKVWALAGSHPELFASVGVHPDYPDVTEPTTEQLVTLAQGERIVAIGETGLDYYRLEGDLEWQRERFRTHIRAARRVGKPLIIHTRAASADTINIMKQEQAGDAGGVMHCFTETWETAQAALDQGFYISFSGIVTFKSAADLREVALKTPIDRILVETDSPYLAPVPRRGKTNEPSYVRHVADFVANLKGISPDRFDETTTDNFNRLFKCL